MADASVATPAAKIGVAGVIWPSMHWPDDAPSRGAGPTRNSGSDERWNRRFCGDHREDPDERRLGARRKTALDKAYSDVHQQRSSTTSSVCSPRSLRTRTQSTRSGKAR
jgi:hypothetical protein